MSIEGRRNMRPTRWQRSTYVVVGAAVLLLVVAVVAAAAVVASRQTGDEVHWARLALDVRRSESMSRADRWLRQHASGSMDSEERGSPVATTAWGVSRCCC